MTTLFSEEYYRNNAINFDGQRGVITPDEDLERELSIFSNLPTDAIDKLRQIYAGRVAERISDELIGRKAMYLAVRKDSGCLGYISKTQEVQEAGRIVRVFEYNCFKLAQFKKKYNI